MAKYVAKRLLLTLVMILIISFAIFVALDNTGVDPISQKLGMENYTAEAAAELRQKLGLNDPLIPRYFRWWGDILRGDFGYSIARGYSIREGLIAKWPATLEISLIALVVSTIVGIGIGMLSAIWQNSIIDYLGRGIAAIGNSVPEYFFALLLIQFFSIRFHWIGNPFQRIPAGAVTFWDRLPNLILPVSALAIPMCGKLMRYTRNTMLDVANQEYVKLARSKGIPEWKVYIRHVFRNSMRPVVTVLLFRMTLLLGGSVAVETIFNWPGVGIELTNAITSSDYTVVMLYTLMMAILMLTISFLVDLFAALLDPRVRLDG